MSDLFGRPWPMSMRRKALFLEALFYTFLAWAMVRLTPYTLWRSQLGRSTPLPPAANGGGSLSLRPSPVQDVAWAHARLEEMFGQRFTCLMLALSASWMLRRRKLPSTLILGTRRSPGQGPRLLGAHAWVLSGGFEVVGALGGKDYVPVAAFCSHNKLETPSGECT
jgi:hypothetical protein